MGLTPYGFLHSDICGSFRACQSPQLFAAYRVLLRLLMPRHPPCALISLTFAELCLVSFVLNLRFKPTEELEIVYPIIWIFTLLIVSSLLFRYSIFKEQLSLRRHLKSLKHFYFFGGHKWTRTIDLTLIRRAL